MTEDPYQTLWRLLEEATSRNAHIQELLNGPTLSEKQLDDLTCAIRDNNETIKTCKESLGLSQ